MSGIVSKNNVSKNSVNSYGLILGSLENWGSAHVITLAREREKVKSQETGMRERRKIAKKEKVQSLVLTRCQGFTR